MTDELYARYIRFHTPDPHIAPREQVSMSAEHLAWAKQYGVVHQFSWLSVLLPPLCFGPMLPGLAFLLGLLLYQAVFDGGLDVDRIIGDSFAWLAVATVVFTAAWALRNYWRDKRDPTTRYWQRMPEAGVVEVERHTLIEGFSVWANNYDPDCNTLTLWADGELKSVQDSGVAQWVLAKTTAGHWLVVKKGFAGDFSYSREGQMPDAHSHLQPGEELTVAFAPGTHISLGQHFSGAPIPMVTTPYWLTADELKHLAEVAHHWLFFPPDRYGVVNKHDAGWVQRLVDKALASVGPQSERG